MLNELFSDGLLDESIGGETVQNEERMSEPLGRYDARARQMPPSELEKPQSRVEDQETRRRKEYIHTLLMRWPRPLGLKNGDETKGRRQEELRWKEDDLRVVEEEGKMGTN